MDYCRACGSEVDDGVPLCPQCGSPLDTFAEPPSPQVDEVLLREVWELARRGSVIEAIKRYREATGCDLMTAKSVVDGLLASGGVGDRFLSRRQPMEHLEAEVLDLARNQGKIAAIKRYRDAQVCGLKEAKDAVEALLVEHGVEPRSGSGCASVLLLGVAVGFGCWWGC